MARIVLGLASSHSPNVSTVPELWHLHAERDRANPKLDFRRLVDEAPTGLEGQLTAEMFQQKHDRCQKAIEELSNSLRQAKVDAVVVIGDDQRELFLDECLPAFAIFTGAELVDFPPAPETVPPSHKPALWSRHADSVERYPTNPSLASHIAESMTRQCFDIAVSGAQLDDRSLGHAYTFVRLRMMRENLIPLVPIFVNCYYPPNQPTPERCFDFGRALRRAIESWDAQKSVALVASGGLSHFVIDEKLDRQVLDGIEHGQRDSLITLPIEKLNSGNSEIRNWIVVAGAMEDMKAEVLYYTPAYRSEAATGCGMGFARWT